ncbi:cysteine proteinase [Trichuris trichiura]|uniref:Cysteine proteinase n=1 Tax=Trichuris trichiura TaxID=36087 RepID=A0A077YZI7_TRITR|nr:cysteine proteinase [Trichuris trichiura]
MLQEEDTTRNRTFEEELLGKQRGLEMMGIQKNVSHPCWWADYEYKILKVIQLNNHSHSQYVYLDRFDGISEKEAKKHCMINPLCNIILWNRYNKTSVLYFARFEEIMSKNYVYSPTTRTTAMECNCGKTGMQLMVNVIRPAYNVATSAEKTRNKLEKRQTTIFLGWANQFDLRQRPPAWKSNPVRRKFTSFTSKFKKTYATVKELHHRMQIFQENLCRIDMFNWKSSMNDKQAAKFGITQYSDLTEKEFSSSYTGLKLSKPENAVNVSDEQLLSRFRQVRQAFSWKSCGVLPAVREQGPCGACYAFATSDLIASQYAVDHHLWNKSVHAISAQAIIDCMPEPAAYACEGGRPYGVLKLLAKTRQRLPMESCYPYEMEEGKCRREKCNNETSEAQVEWAKSFNASGSREKELIALLVNWGPVIVTINVPDWLQFYKTGVLQQSQCGKVPEHAVLLVGYDFTAPTPYYIIKNSWGDDWGEEGYMRLEAGRNTCGLAGYAVIACTKDCGKLDDDAVLLSSSNAKFCTVHNFIGKIKVQKVCVLRLVFG